MPTDASRATSQCLISELQTEQASIAQAGNTHAGLDKDELTRNLVFINATCIQRDSNEKCLGGAERDEQGKRMPD